MKTRAHSKHYYRTHIQANGRSEVTMAQSLQEAVGALREYRARYSPGRDVVAYVVQVVEEPISQCPGSGSRPLKEGWGPGEGICPDCGQSLPTTRRGDALRAHRP